MAHVKVSQRLDYERDRSINDDSIINLYYL